MTDVNLDVEPAAAAADAPPAKIAHLTEMSITGFRGFANEQNVHFARPNGAPGSGLTIIVGPNNSGKSTIIEALNAVSHDELPTFNEGSRNRAAGERVEIRLVDSEGKSRTIRTVALGGSQTESDGVRTNPGGSSKMLVLPSRRAFDPYFGRTEWNRDQYSSQYKMEATRSGRRNLSGRLFILTTNADKRAKFDAILGRILSPIPAWTIDQTAQGQFYVKVAAGEHTHSSDGLGEGLISLLFIVDALYDSQPGTVIAIDEPELSLHPQLQARVRDLLVEYSRDRQIIISTHSPKFIDWHSIVSGAQIVRVFVDHAQPQIGELSSESRGKIAAFLKDMFNPHVLGLDANEVFFLSDGVILVEGQEDVLYFPRVLADLGRSISGDFYGWGVGGANKMSVVARILADLGFNKVVGILDSNARTQQAEMSKSFAQYLFVAQPADDIRVKKAADGGDTPSSLLAEDHVTVREEFRDATNSMFDEIEAYMGKGQAPDGNAEK